MREHPTFAIVQVADATSGKVGLGRQYVPSLFGACIQIGGTEQARDFLRVALVGVRPDWCVTIGSLVLANVMLGGRTAVDLVLAFDFITRIIGLIAWDYDDPTAPDCCIEIEQSQLKCDLPRALFRSTSPADFSFGGHRRPPVLYVGLHRDGWERPGKKDGVATPVPSGIRRETQRSTARAVVRARQVGW